MFRTAVWLAAVISFFVTPALAGPYGVGTMPGVPLGQSLEGFGCRESVVDLTIPVQARGGAFINARFPALVVIHGGGWTLPDRGYMRAFAENVTSQGFVVMNVDYPLATRPQNAFPANLNSIKCSIAWLYAMTKNRGLPVDIGKIAVAGHSAGGHLALLLAANPTFEVAPGAWIRLQAGVIFSGASDLRLLNDGGSLRSSIASLITGQPTPIASSRIPAVASPVTSMNGPAPTLWFHSDADTWIPSSQMDAWQSALRKNGFDNLWSIRLNGSECAGNSDSTCPHITDRNLQLQNTAIGWLGSVLRGGEPLITQGYADGLGRRPALSELIYWLGPHGGAGVTYAAVIAEIKSYMSVNPPWLDSIIYAAVKASKQRNRSLSAAEVAYWRKEMYSGRAVFKTIYDAYNW